MGFFRDLSKTAPSYNPELPWPLDGIWYSAMFFTPLTGPLFGMSAAGIVGIGIGILIAAPVWLGNILSFDYILEERIARLQEWANRPLPHVAVNVLGLAWAFALGALPPAGVWFILVR